MHEAPEIQMISAYLNRADATDLFEGLLREVTWDERMKARKTACFGQTYDDSGVEYAFVAMHPFLVPLCDRLEETLGFRPTNCLINYYETGRSTMGFHSDATYNLADGTGVAIVSLGAERSLTFRSKADSAQTVSYALPHGSLFYMTQATQDHWTHAIKKTDTDDSRISLTFRHILTPEEMAARGRGQDEYPAS